jgi:cobalt-zinc-cadmium efflux system protein
MDSHEHGHDHATHLLGNKKALIISLIITAGIMVIEFFGGIFTNSLALLSDAGHMLSDVGSLALSLFAASLSTKAPSAKKTYGFYRSEILAALLNGIVLFVIASFIIWEAYGRFFDTPAVDSGPMMLIAFIGLLANVVSAWVIMQKGNINENLNLRSAYLHIIGDALGSIGAIIAGFLMLYFSWYIADPIISIIVALLILKSAWRVIDETVHILMEGTPSNLDWEAIRNSLLEISGVKDVHDLHIWTITSGKNMLTCHFLIEKEQDSQKILEAAIVKLEEKFQITHTTIQIETEEFSHPSCEI